MKAIRLHENGGPENYRYEDVPEPQPEAGQVLVAVEATGVNFIEVYQRRGLYPLPLPMTPGSEGAGRVLALGANVGGFAAGDRVAWQGGAGAYAERAVVPAERVVRLPDGVSTKQGAAVMLQGMTAHYLACSTRPLGPGDACLVHAAAGGVGLLLCQIARKRGARVFGTVSTPEKAALAREAGADEVILYTEQDFVAEVNRRTGGAGVQAVFDSVGKTTFEGSLKCLAVRGTLALYGQSSGPVPPVDPQALNRAGSVYLTRPMLGHYTMTRQELLGRANELFAWIADGSLRLRIGAEYPLSQAAEAHRALEGRKTTGKVLLIPGA
jgi:NADPH:quinone reductase